MLSTLRNRFATRNPFEPAFEPAFEPWSDLRREIDRLFDSVVSGTGPTGVRSDAQWMPPMDVEEQDDAIRLALELPGVNPDDVNVSVENGVLTIAGEKKYSRESGDETKGARFVERRYGRFERVLALPQSVNAEKISASYDNGVLTLELPKAAESRRRKIEIGRGITQKRIHTGEQGGRKFA
jgi:HSP20 family protein